MLDVDLEVVLEVLPHARQVGDDVDAERAQFGRAADARQLQQLRRVDRAAAQDHLAGARGLGSAAADARILDAGRAPALEQDPRRHRMRLHVEVRPAHHGVQVRPRGGQPAAVVHVAVELREALLAVAVHVVGEREAGLLHGGEERVEQRADGRPALEDERSVMAAERIVGSRCEAVLHPLEVRQAVGVVPGLHPGVARPALVVQRVAALEDHAVDRAGPAEHLAARVVDPAAVHVRLGLGLVLPVVEPVADGERQRGRHVDEDVPEGVVAPCFENQDPSGRIGREPVRQCAAGGASTDDDEIVLGGRHGADISKPDAHGQACSGEFCTGDEPDRDRRAGMGRRRLRRGRDR